MRKSVIAIIVIVLVVLYMSIFVVKEGERGITLRFGKVLRDDENKPLVYAPGLHFKIPFIESVKMLDARIQTMDNQADRFVTKEKKDLIVDSYIKWRISDFSRYYLATGGGDVSQAEVLLKRKFSDRLRSEIGRLDVKDIVTDSRGRLTLEVRDALNSGSAGTEDEVTTPAADNAIAEAAERVTAEIADTPFDVRVDDQVFLLFGHKAVGLVVHGLNTCVEHFHRFNERYLEMQTRLINQRFVVIVTQYLTKTQRNTALTFFDDKDRHVKHYQHDDDNRDN